ncbi:MAG: hypothetical protein U0270_42445 [Labilithrix sp.]
MPSSKYPLQPLLEHRERAVDDRTAELGGAVRARENAERAKAQAAASQRAAQAEAAAVRAHEQDRLAQGELSVADLARGQAWEIGAQARIAALGRATATADDKARAATSAESAARGQLAQAMADRDVVTKDEARFKERLVKKQVAAEEEQAEEAWRGDKK